VTAGSREERLRFDTVNFGNWWGEEDTGYRLDHGRTYLINDFLDEIWAWITGCMGGGWGGSPCPTYRAPAYNYVDVDLSPYDDLTFGMYIEDQDDNPNDTLFDADYTIQAEDISEDTSGLCLVPGYCVIEDRNITLTVLLSTIGW